MGPWDVNENIPEEYVEAAFMLGGKIQRYQKTMQEIEAMKARIRSKGN